MLTQISAYPGKGIAGQRVGDNHHAVTLINNAPETAKIVDLAITAQNAADYTVTIDGVPVKITSDGTATVAEIRDALIAAINADAFAGPKVKAEASGNDVRLTERKPSAGEVTLAVSANLAATVQAAHSEKEPLPAGVAVVKTAKAQECRLPRGAGTKLAGVTEHVHASANSDLAGDALYEPNQAVTVGKRGTWLVKPETAVDPTAPVYFRHEASSTNKQLGAFRADSDGGKATLVAAAEWASAASAGDLAEITLSLP